MWSAAIVLTLIGLFLLWILVIFNRLVTLRNQATQAWKRLDAELKRRHDLIPNVVLEVQRAVNPEPAALIRVIDAHNPTLMAGGVAQKAAEEGRISRALQAFFAEVERSPAMQSSERLQPLLRQLRDIEYRLVSLAQSYNLHAGALNEVRETFPADVLAGTFHFRPATLFDISADSDCDVPQD
jgi:LemA protein